MTVKLLFLVFNILIFTQGCKSKNLKSQKTYEIYNFNEIKIGMSYDEVFELMDSPEIIIGFNFKWLIYNLKDDFQIKLGFLPNGILMNMDIVDPNGRVFSLNQDDKE